MKQVIITITLSLLICLTLSAQRSGEGRERIKEWKIAYITEKLDLSEEESQKFWPIYNAKEKEMKAIRSSRTKMSKMEEIDALTEAEAEKLINEHINARQAELDVRKKYIAKFREAIPYKKIAKLPKVETQFKRTILEKMRGRR